MDLEIRNAVIISASLSTADHGVLSSFVHLDYGGSGQGFGGYALYSPEHRSDATGLWIWRILEVVGVTEWADLKGKPVRVRGTHSGLEALGHFIEDRWFWPRQEFADWERNK